MVSSSCATALTTWSYQLTEAMLRQSLTAVTTNKRNLLCSRIQHTECTQSTDCSTTLPLWQASLLEEFIQKLHPHGSIPQRILRLPKIHNATHIQTTGQGMVMMDAAKPDHTHHN